MRFLDLVEHEHRMRCPHYRLGEQSALVKSDISWRRSDQPRHGVRLGVFAHVVTQEFDAEHLGKLFRNLGLADAGRSRKEERAYRLGLVAETRTRDLDRIDNAVDRLVLAKDDLFYV